MNCSKLSGIRPVVLPLFSSLCLFATHIEASNNAIELTPIGTFVHGSFDESAAEIVDHDPDTQHLFIANAEAATVDILDINDPTLPSLVGTIDATAFGAEANSVAVNDGVVAVAIEAGVTQDPGTVAFYDTNGSLLNSVQVGALPDNVVFTRNGRWVLVANEGEPSDDYSVDPEGSVSVINMSAGAANVTQRDVRTAGFTQFNGANLDPSIRIYGPNATVAQDLEPEFIATSHNSRKAWVTLQENNAIGVIDIRQANVTKLVGLGFKDHNGPRNKFDASNEDGGINITNWPTLGMYQPDAIASFRHRGITYLVTANEGDSRDYGGFSEEIRVKDITLDPTAFPNAAFLQDEANLGRLKTTTVNGDTDNDGDFDKIFSYGARSFSIWRVRNNDGLSLRHDSGDDLEQITAAALPTEFNSTNDENNSFDDRSDDKGPEPEGVTIAKIKGNTYAFLGLERIGGIAVFKINNPSVPQFVQYINTRDFGGDPAAGTAGDLGPEGILFIKKGDSPINSPLLVVGNEVSGTTTIFSID